MLSCVIPTSELDAEERALTDGRIGPETVGVDRASLCGSMTINDGIEVLITLNQLWNLQEILKEQMCNVKHTIYHMKLESQKKLCFIQTVVKKIVFFFFRQIESRSNFSSVRANMCVCKGND